MGNPLTPPGAKLKFFSVYGEIYRTYVFPGYDEVTISGSVSMAIDKSDGSHRILDKSGKAHFIMANWIHLFWEVEPDGNPIFPF